MSRALVHVVAHHLLGRHVAGRSDREADSGEVGGLSRSARKSEVREHRAAVRVDQDVGRLEVAVDDACIVRVLQAVADLTQVAPCGQRVERPSIQDVAQRAAADQRHGQERDTLRDLEVVDREDVGVVQLGERLGLGLEPFDKSLVLEQLRRQRFQRDLAA